MCRMLGPSRHNLVVYLIWCLIVPEYNFFPPMFLQETQDPSAALWLDEIQDTILKANQDTQEASQCERKHKSHIISFH